MLTINLEWDANALAAPQSFRDVVQAAANVLDAAIFNPITVNIVVGYGEIDLGQPFYQLLTDNYSLGGVNRTLPVSYPALRTALAGVESSAAAVQAVNALPNTLALNGQSNFSIPTGLAKALGVIPAAETAVDGEIGFPTSFTGNGLLGTAIVEELHALGLLNGGGDLGLVSYTGPGSHYLPSNAANASTAYFSLDGGYTALAPYAVGSDETLFTSQPNDPLDFPNQGTVLTPLDLAEISAIGFDTTSTPVLPVPGIVPQVTAVGTRPAVTTQNVSVAENGSVFARSLLQSASAPSGDSLAVYGFYDLGNGTGHLSLGGLAEPDRQWIYVLSTELNSLTYVGGSSPGSETIAVEALDFPAYTFSPVSQLTATTTAAVAPSGANPPTYSIAANDAGAAASTPDGMSGLTGYQFTVSRTGDLSQASTLTYAVAGSGTNPAPASLFQNTSGTVTLAAGAASATLTVNAVGAAVANPEGFTVTISGGNGLIAVPVAADTVGANGMPPDPGTVAINAAAVYAFGNTGAPRFTAAVNADGSSVLPRGASGLTGGFIGGYVAGIEIRIMANLETAGGSTAQIDTQFGRDMHTLSSLLPPSDASVGFGFLAGLTTGGPTGLVGGGVPGGLGADIRAALGSDASATAALAGCVTGAVVFTQGYVAAVAAGQGPITALRGVESAALV